MQTAKTPITIVGTCYVPNSRRMPLVRQFCVVSSNGRNTTIKHEESRHGLHFTTFLLVLAFACLTRECRGMSPPTRGLVTRETCRRDVIHI